MESYVVENVSHSPLLLNLNDVQLSATTHKDGPAVVYAGAGSGKTRVICSRIAWLIQTEKVFPSSILAVTFTNKAAKEMNERIEHLIGARQAKNLSVSTFHSFCAKFLRIYSLEAGFQPNFSIYDDDDQKGLLKDILKNLNVPDKLLSVQTVKSKIDKLKNKGTTPDEYWKEIKEKPNNVKEEVSLSFRRFGEEQYDPVLIHKIYKQYQDKLKQLNSMDFNDLLLVFYTLIVENNLVLHSLQNRFRYFLIDEFQDTNPLQFKLITKLCSHTNNLFIVGDDDQSIYSWRGAEPSFILNFHNLFSNVKIFKLEENYRSTDKIISAAKSVIGNNKVRAEKSIFTQKNNGQKIKVIGCPDAYTEASEVANSIYTSIQDGSNFSDFCCLYRTNAQSRSLEDELRRRMMPYVIYGSVRFYERAEVKVLMHYLKIMINTADDASFQKVVNTPRRGFGESALEKLKHLANSNHETLAKCASEIVYGNLENNVGRSIGGLKTFIIHLQKWKQQLIDGMKGSQLLNIIIHDINFENYIRASYPEEADERWLNVIELKNALEEFENNFQISQQENNVKHSSEEILAQFMEQALLVIEPTTKNASKGEANAITLMTIHSAKGLEFSQVFLCGLEEGVLPHQNSLYEPSAVEEERRLMYVAMTRAQNNLTLTYSESNRFKQFMPAQQSRFISEIPHECLDFIGTTRRSFAKPKLSTFQDAPRVFRDFPTSTAMESLPASMSNHFDNQIAAEQEDAEWRHGQRVSHKVFGEGCVCGIEKSQHGFRLRIRFDSCGEKTVVHSYVTALT